VCWRSEVTVMADVWERIPPGHQAEVVFSRFRRIRLWESHRAIKASLELKRSLALPHRL
jgi:hypothetical protein